MAKLNWERASSWRKTQHNAAITTQPQRNKSIVNFGKYSGHHINNIPIDYIEWFVINCQTHSSHSVFLDEWHRRWKRENSNLSNNNDK
jgi:hypothetical protein